MDLKWDGGWDFVAVIFTIIGAVYAYTQWLLKLPNKAFDWRIMSNTRLLNVDKTLRSRVKILLDDKPVQTVHSVQIELVNTGRATISKDDFEKEIRVHFGKGVEVLSFRAIGVPKEMDPQWKLENHTLRLEKVMFNSGNAVLLNVLVSDVPTLRVEGHISGVTELRRVHRMHYDGSPPLFTDILTPIVAGVMAISMFTLGQDSLITLMLALLLWWSVLLQVLFSNRLRTLRRNILNASVALEMNSSTD